MEKQTKKRAPVWLKSMAAVLFWLVVWQLLVMWLNWKSTKEVSFGSHILLASPFETIKTLVLLMQTAEFWKAVTASLCKIASGFFLAVLAGSLCAMLAAASRVVRVLLTPLFSLIKAVPVASFIILVLFWFSSRNLSVLISFLMVLPVIYTNVLQGIEVTEKELLEMAEVFHIPFRRRVRYIYLPAVLPYFVSACSVGLGFCFKSGIAAEIIGLPQNSIGERLYEAKLYLLTEEVFAWTAVIILVSVIFEKVVMLLVKALAKALAGNVKKTQSPETETFWQGVRESASEKETTKKDVLPERQGMVPGGPDTLPTNTASEDYGLFEVTKGFKEKNVLEEMSLVIVPGETVALMGASGCGKSTAGRLLLGLLEPDAGEVKHPKHMGAVFQEDRLCKGFDAVTNVAMVTGNRKVAEEALFEVGLAGLGRKPVEELSGGMKRRVAIVRAMLSDGELIVLDEPFTGLDEASKQKVLRYVKRGLRGRRALLITHTEAEAAYLADRVVRLGQ